MRESYRPTLGRRAARVGVFGALALTVVTGADACGMINDSMNWHTDYAAAKDGGATKEIESRYADATNITVHAPSRQPAYMSWDLKNGDHCTAQSSSPHNNGGTPDDILIGTVGCTGPVHESPAPTS